MEGIIEFNKAAFRHNITEKDIRYAFAYSVFDHPLAGEEEKHLLIGFDTKANLLEVLYNVIDDQKINVFHAMECRNNWRKYAERWEE